MTTQMSKASTSQARVIENITDEKTICGIRYVKVGWKNTPYYGASWEPLEVLRDEDAYQDILRSKGLLYDEHITKSSCKANCSTEGSKSRNYKSKQNNSTNFNRQRKESLNMSTSPTENHMDDDSTSVNDIRCPNEGGKEGTVSLFSKTKQIKFLPYIIPKTRLTTNFYRNLIEYYRLCQRDQTPLPLHEIKNQTEKIQPSADEQLQAIRNSGKIAMTKGDIAQPYSIPNTKITNILDHNAKSTPVKTPEKEDKIAEDASTQNISSRGMTEPMKHQEGSSDEASLDKREVCTGPVVSLKPNISKGMFSELLSLAKAKLLSRKGMVELDTPNIFCKFEDREGIANRNAEDYDETLMAQVSKKAPLHREAFSVGSKPPSALPQIPLLLPASEAKQVSKPYIPNQPTVTLSVAMKINFVK